jgi:copper chaperone CopZ
MKINIFVKIVATTLLMLMLSTVSFAQNNNIVTEEIKISGNCGQCQERIEKACYRIGGVQKAVWDEKTGILTVTYNSRKTTNDKIQASIAKFGHDTPNHKASEKGYKKLPECCLYRDGNPHQH